MYIIFATVVIAILSIVLSIISLKNIEKGVNTKEAKESLRKERVVFHSSDKS